MVHVLYMHGTSLKFINSPLAWQVRIVEASAMSMI